VKTVKTPRGTELPLVNLKGKDYLMVAHRLQWFNEAAENFKIETTLIKAEKDESVVQAKVTVFKTHVLPNGVITEEILKCSTATKREDSKGFGDHLEKAETGAIGRALALLGYGTQFAMADLDEGQRIVDSPLVSPKSFAQPGAVSNPPASNYTVVTDGIPTTRAAIPPKANGAFGAVSSFRKNAPK